MRGTYISRFFTSILHSGAWNDTFVRATAMSSTETTLVMNAVTRFRRCSRLRSAPPTYLNMADRCDVGLHTSTHSDPYGAYAKLSLGESQNTYIGR